MTSPTAPHRYRSRSTSLLERPVLGRAFERAGEGAHSRSCSGSSGEALTPDPSPHGKAVHYAICELGESALDDGEVDDVGRVGLFANGARWGWPSGAGPVHPNRRLSASLSLGGQSLPSTFNIAPLARVMSAGAARAPSARSPADSNTPEGLGLFRRLSVGFGPKVRTQSAPLNPVLTVSQPTISPPGSTFLAPTPTFSVAAPSPIDSSFAEPAPVPARTGGRRLSVGNGVRKKRGISPMGEKMLFSNH